MQRVINEEEQTEVIFEEIVKEKGFKNPEDQEMSDIYDEIKEK
jgi:hypothetical protein